jgi:GT2 family glycosyltransferase
MGQDDAGAVSVVVCCRDRAELLAEALPHVQAELAPGDELVVVDSASRTADVGSVARAAGATVLRCEQPGLSRARNAGWRAASRPVVLFTDDDCRPLPGWRDAAVRALAEPKVGAVWGDVRADRDSGIPLSVGTSGLDELTPASDLSQTGHGACMAYRREVLEQLGGFDEELGAGGRFPSGEDKDAFWRALRGGWRVRAALDMAVTHVVHRDDTEARRVMVAYGVGAGVVATKRARSGDSQPHLVLGEVWRHGLLPAARWARSGRYAAATGALVRAAGVVRGWSSVRRWRVVDGHLVPPSGGDRLSPR